MLVICPHCQHLIDSTQLPSGEVLCPSCGSTLVLDRGSTTDIDRTQCRRRLGKFELLGLLGAGAFGNVYKARDTELDRIVAVKVPRGGTPERDKDQDRFLREARSVAQLRHPAIVTVHEIGQHEGLPYLVLDFVNGLTLADRLTGERLPPREVAELVAVLADALQYAHDQGIVHRDVKPSNIMLERRSGTQDGPPSASPAAAGRFVPRLMDFGLARRDAGEVTMTLEGQVLGTPAYMSPEQARGEAHRVDGRSDTYSLGVVLYELLTGALPFQGNARLLLQQVLHNEPRPPRQRDPRVPKELETICLKAMAKEPARRYATAGELAEDLRRFLRGEPIRARPVGRTERLRRWCRRNPAVAGLAVSSAMLLVALSVLVVRDLHSPVQLLRVFVNPKSKAADPEEERRQIAALAQGANDQMLAVARGVNYLIAHGPSPRGGPNPVGVTSLRALTLLECGVPTTEPVLQKAAELVRKAVPKVQDTYQRAAAVLFLDRLGDKQDEECIQYLSLCLLSGQRSDGGSGYTCPTLDRKATAGLLEQLRDNKQLTVKGFDPGRSDNSNTQFAILALWAARRHGVPIRRATALVEKRFRSTQLAKGPDPTGRTRDLDGAWSYQSREFVSNWPSMTCAGLVGLAVARGVAEEGAQDKKILEDDSVRRGLAMLGREINQTDEKRPADLFFLWSLERVGVLYKLRTISEKDWYGWGRRILLTRQRADGSWNQGNYPGSNPVLNTCFALLFLKQSNLTQDLTNKLHRLTEEP